MAGVLATSAGFSIAWGAIVNALEPTIDGTYMPFTTTRLYVPFVHLENPQAIISKPVKKVRFNDCYALVSANNRISLMPHSIYNYWRRLRTRSM
ncbi:hypothetical protein PF005_g25800 [Phytophthora fragariae]|uniref:Uncharacterized protein n=1 Tax=Phytophthora fragariae TaxID=53985 RepID=A0A6A3QC92_9STRA|nr:hypothetical protein PF003_g36480 [Phytophthora fragariae]KAE8920250.1 hypothetical protein PF009_g29453 [Phytophthora fragariae]KAE9071509.1 hypothetical protein PF010_g25848 [Phytophthora fragariae]KAE9073350.1 hypothetical protein PF007_g25837 [Phytophthora fragariae]KAE9090186.1 hypothetical protein PF006_g25208 [Phytophthora fragariae]